MCEDSPKWRTTRLLFIPSSIAICAFPAVPLIIWLKIRSTNESRLFAGSRHSSVRRKIKLTVRWQMNWANLCSWNNYLLSSIHPFFFYYFALFFLFCTFILLLFFYPRLFLVRTCVLFVQAATPLHALLLYPHRTSNATGKHSHFLLIRWSLIRFFFIVTPCKVYHLKV